MLSIDDKIGNYIRCVGQRRNTMTDQKTIQEGNRASIVALGILASRVLGLIRWSIMARYFGSGAHADVLRAAFQAPNALQNLLGEGTMSAAFIPVYSRMLAEGKPEAAGRFAGAILGFIDCGGLQRSRDRNLVGPSNLLHLDAWICGRCSRSSGRGSAG